jgi:Tol biopolymer transport system component
MGLAAAFGPPSVGAIAAVGGARPPVVERVSVSSRGTQGNGDSFGVAISRHGRFVLVLSDATNLVPQDRNAREDLFLVDRRRHRVTRVVRNADPGPTEAAPTMTPDARYIGFQRGLGRWFILDRRTGATTRMTVGATGRPVPAWVDDPVVMSADGRHVAFSALESGVVPGDHNRRIDVFVRDRVARTTSRVSVGAGGTEADGDSLSPAISADGRYVAFSSDADDLVPADTNGTEDVFVRDRVARTTTRVSVSSSGEQANRGAGRFAGLGSRLPAISADGRLVAFSSVASNLVAGDSNAAEDVFVHDRVTGVTTRVSVSTAGGQADGESWEPSFLGGGLVQFFTSATDLLPARTNGGAVVHDTRTGATVPATVDPVPGERSTGLLLSADGRWAVFSSSAAGHVRRDTNRRSDAFVAGPLDPRSTLSTEAR